MMKNHLFLILLVLFAGCKPKIYECKIRNPLLAGFYSDPSICRVGEDYYLVTSTFAYFPGIPIFHSKNLITWRQIGNVITDNRSFDYTNLSVSDGMYAPSIRYYKGNFYVICTFIGGEGNFVMKSHKPEGPWEGPFWIPEINGINLSLFFDDDGKAYILYNSVVYDNKPLYNGHRTIRLCEFNFENMKVKGDKYIIVDSISGIEEKPIWIEGSHIFKFNGYYYLIAKKGDTGYNHSEVVFRSKNIYGPYEAYNNNRNLTQRHIIQDKISLIAYTGHADFVLTSEGEWWAVFLGYRPYKMNNYYNTGGETYIAPVKWVDDWPIINYGYEEIQLEYVIRSSKPCPKVSFDDFYMRDDFLSDTLAAHWLFLRQPIKKWYSMDKKKGYLTIQLQSVTCGEKSNPSFIGYRQRHINSEVTIKMNFKPMNNYEKAGLLVFQNETHYYLINISKEKNDYIVELNKSTNDPKRLILLNKLTIKHLKNGVILKIKSSKDGYTFFCHIDGKTYTIGKNINPDFLSKKIADGFVGCVYAMYATSTGIFSNNKAYFDWFEYKGNDFK